MIDKKMQDALNEQVNAELFSAYLYLSMEAYFQSIGLSGFANWMRCQTQEELVHAMKLFDYLNQRNGRVTLKQIAAPKTVWKSPLDAFQDAYSHEQKVTTLINKLVDVAHFLKDHATSNFLQWFVAEQVEEEASASAVVDKLKLVGKAGEGMFQLDKELAQRVFASPVATQKE